MSDVALRTRGLIKDFDAFRALKGLDLEVPRAGIFGLLGPNGSGKTTTIRCCLGVYVADGGSVELLGASDPLAVRHRVGYLPEERGLYPKMQVHEQLAFLGTIRGLSLSESNRRATAWLERLGLDDRAKSLTNELSKGMQQKVQLAAALIHEPEMAVLDEPFSGLDPVNSRLFRDVILEQKRRGCTIMLSSHRMEQVEQMCDRLGLVHRGELVLQGRISDIRAGYGRSTLAIDYEGDGAALDGLPGVRHVSDSGRSARLHMEADADPQQIVRALLDRVRLHSFRSEEPSVEEIFLKAVGHGEAARLAISEQGDLVEGVSS